MYSIQDRPSGMLTAVMPLEGVGGKVSCGSRWRTGRPPAKLPRALVDAPEEHNRKDNQRRNDLQEVVVQDDRAHQEAVAVGVKVDEDDNGPEDEKVGAVVNLEKVRHARVC